MNATATDALRRDDWFVTASGHRFFLLDPRPEDIRIEDIAHALAQVCRFGGHCQPFYSVAQHSVLVSRVVPPEHALAGLLHDAPEAYVGDVIRPLKRLLPEYRKIEDRVWSAICRRFGIAEQLPTEVKHADMVALATERRDLVRVAHERAGEWRWIEDELGVSPHPEPITALVPGEARRLFVARFRDLTGR